MFPLLVLLFIVLPIAEIFVILEVGHAIGPWWTILVLVIDSIAGAALLRRQGRSVWMRFQDALANRRMPHREILDGVLVLVGGVLLLTPGFITDFLGLILLIPPSRAVVRRISLRFFTPAGMARVVFVRSTRGPSTGPPPARHVDQPPPSQLPPG